MRLGDTILDFRTLIASHLLKYWIEILNILGCQIFLLLQVFGQAFAFDKIVIEAKL